MNDSRDLVKSSCITTPRSLWKYRKTWNTVVMLWWQIHHFFLKNVWPKLRSPSDSWPGAKYSCAQVSLEDRKKAFSSLRSFPVSKLRPVCLSRFNNLISLSLPENIHKLRFVCLLPGTTMKNLVERLLQVSECEYKPKHTRNLANEFSCYTNFEAKFVNSVHGQETINDW